MVFRKTRSLFEQRKGVTPVIATILLVGVAVFAVGTVYTVVQTELADWKQGTGVPNSELVLKSAASQSDPGLYCASGDGGVVVQHKGGEPVSMDQIQVIIRTESNPQPVIAIPETSEKLSSGQNLGFFRVSSAYPRVSLPAVNHCNTISANRAGGISAGETVSVTIAHERSGEIMLEGTVTAESTLNAYPY